LQFIVFGYRRIKLQIIEKRREGILAAQDATTHIPSSQTSRLGSSRPSPHMTAQNIFTPIGPNIEALLLQCMKADIATPNRYWKESRL